MRRFFGELILLSVVTIWGLAFVWQNLASQSLDPLTIVGLRCIIAIIFLVLIIVFIPTLYSSQNPKIKFNNSFKTKFILPFVCGTILFLGMYTQQIGISHTTAGKAGFISVLYICIVPVIGIFLGSKLNRYFLLGLLLCLVGFYLISIKTDFTIEYGDFIVFISSIFYAIHIILIDLISPKINSFFLSIFQLIVVGILSLSAAIIKENITFDNVLKVILPLLALGILSNGIAYTFQIIGQREVPTHIASLIMSLESVVAALGGYFILNETLSTKEFSGMIIVFIGILLSQYRTKK